MWRGVQYTDIVLAEKLDQKKWDNLSFKLFLIIIILRGLWELVFQLRVFGPIERYCLDDVLVAW